MLNKILEIMNSNEGTTLDDANISNPLYNGRWRIPSYQNLANNLSNVRKANKYLRNQERRLMSSIENKQYEKAMRIFMFLNQRSWSYKVYWINKVMKGWYFNMDLNVVKSILIRLNRLTNKINGNLRSNRVYIEKPNGGIRPLGCPRIDHRIYNAMWADFLYRLLEDKLPDWQFGFRRDRSILLMWKEIWTYIETLEKKLVFEFDLKKFFSRASPHYIRECMIADGFPDPVSNFVYRVNSILPLTSGVIENDDGEMVKGDVYESKLMKSGLPQGLPWSPILCIYALGKVMAAPPESKLFMFADDGIIVADKIVNVHKILRGEEMICKLGAVVSDKKKTVNGEVVSATDWVFNNILKFCGLVYDIQKDKILLDNNVWVPRNSLSDEALEKILIHSYHTAPVPTWKWKIRNDSWLWLNRELLSLDNIGMIYKKLLNIIENRKDTLYFFWGKVWDWTKESSHACEYLLKEQREIIKKNGNKRIRLEQKFDSLAFLIIRQQAEKPEANKLRDEITRHLGADHPILPEIVERDQLMNAVYPQYNVKKLITPIEFSKWIAASRK